jgi:hypothetical protein
MDLYVASYFVASFTFTAKCCSRTQLGCILQESLGAGAGRVHRQCGPRDRRLNPGTSPRDGVGVCACYMLFVTSECSSTHGLGCRQPLHAII